jgi:hypothetical protein
MQKWIIVAQGWVLNFTSQKMIFCMPLNISLNITFIMTNLYIHKIQVEWLTCHLSFVLIFSQ